MMAMRTMDTTRSHTSNQSTTIWTSSTSMFHMFPIMVTETMDMGTTTADTVTNTPPVTISPLTAQRATISPPTTAMTATLSHPTTAMTATTANTSTMTATTAVQP